MINQKEPLDAPLDALKPARPWVPEGPYQKRLRLIARWRQRRLIEWLGTFEPGPAPYGVKQ